MKPAGIPYCMIIISPYLMIISPYDFITSSNHHIRRSFWKAPAHAGAGGFLRGVPFRGSLLEEESPRGGEWGPSYQKAPSLFGAVSARLALLGDSLGPLSAPSHHPVALLRLPWDPFGAFSVHFLSLLGGVFFGGPFLRRFWTPK